MESLLVCMLERVIGLPYHYIGIILNSSNYIDRLYDTEKGYYADGEDALAMRLTF